MKINAMEGRGSRKDFIDIHLLLQHYTLDELLSFYVQKYPNYSIFRALLSLTYFDDAESPEVRSVQQHPCPQPVVLPVPQQAAVGI